MSASPRTGYSLARIVGAVLLASAAAGCSSDATRFSTLLGDKDNLTTNSVPRRHITGFDGKAPVPDSAVAANGAAGQLPPVSQDYNTRGQAMSQPMPGRSGAYDPIRTSTTSPSAARDASMAAPVQRAELAAPMPAAANSPERSAALSQPLPGRQDGGQLGAAPQPLRAPQSAAATGAQPGAVRVTLARGETVTTLSRRYGISEQAILKANGMKSGAEAATGQSIIIPGATAPSVAQAAAQPGTLAAPGNVPLPRQAPGDQRVAVLPGSAASTGRDKQVIDPNAKPAPNAGKSGATYVVKPGDTIAKIAHETGTPINALKAANGLNAQPIKVGQVLKLPAGGRGMVAQAPADTLKTGTVPPQKAEAPKAQTAPHAAAQQPAAQPARDSVTEVASASKDEAPESTGIGKYRWPARGAVIAGYGENVEGKRNDGIDISVPQGTAIKAAENGVVIYAGNGLKELGNTVLVRHDDGTVTVYGHADSLAVARGQKVQRGQQLATSGMSGSAKRPMLHFEVRKNATPVNPMGFLE